MSSKLIETKLEEYLEFKNGKTSPERNDFSPYPVYGSNGIIGYSNNYNSTENTIVIGRVGSYCGSVYLSEQKCWVTDNAIICKSINEKETAFWYYVLLTLNLNNHQTGSGQPLLNQSILNSIATEIPDQDSDRIKIGETIKCFDDKIANNNRINQTLEAIAQALFKSWFVDFEPVNAKIQAIEEGNDPQMAAMCAISGKTEEELQQLPPEKYNELAATADLFPDELVESDSEDYADGLIPKGWMLKPFGELLERTVGGDWGLEVPDEKHTVEVKIIRGTDIPTIQSGGIEKVPTRFVEEKKLKSRQLQDGDIVIEISGGSPTQPTGRSIMITKNILERLNLPAEPASFCRLFRPNNKILSYFLAQHLVYIYNNGKTWLYQNQSTGISNFQTSMFLENEIIATPPKEILKHFLQKIEPLINRISSNENIKLAEVRDSLLPKLLTGEIALIS